MKSEQKRPVRQMALRHAIVTDSDFYAANWGKYIRELSRPIEQFNRLREKPAEAKK